MTMVKTLVALATERMLLKTSGPTFLRGIEFMYAAGLAPDRLSVMMTSSHKYVLQFHSKCDIRPFAANYPNFGRVLRGIVHVREWRIKSIEFVNVAFYMRDVDNLERAIEKLGVELVLLRNCTYPGVQRGDEAVKFLSALNRKKQAVVCEYGDDRLKHRIGRRTSGNRARRASRNGQEVIAPPQDPAEVPAPAAPAPPAPVAAPDPIGDPPAALNNDPVPMAPAPPPHPVRAAAHHPALLRRPIPLNPVQARRVMPLIANPPPGPAARQVAPPPPPPAAAAPQNAPAAPEAPPANPQQNGIPGRDGRVVVGGHVYEFRAVDVPNADNIPAVQNLNHLLNVLSENSHHDVRVIVLPPEGRPEQPVQQNDQNNQQNNAQNNEQNNQNNMPSMNDLNNLRAMAMAAAVMANGLLLQNASNEGGPLVGAQRIADFRGQQLSQQELIQAAAEASMQFHAYQQQQQQHQPNNGQPALFVPIPVPMFVGEGNVRLGQRAGDESNDSTDREEMYDPEQQRNEALRDLVADPEAQPNFAPVQAQAIDLEELEEEADDDDVMEEGASGEGQFMMVDQPEPVVP